MSKRNRKTGRRTGKENVLPYVGITQDGKKIVTGVYEFHETYGMPLSDLFLYLKNINLIPDWIDIYKWGRKNGMKHARIISKIKDPIEDSYGKSFADNVCRVLDTIFGN
jgi:hypothetical protein